MKLIRIKKNENIIPGFGISFGVTFFLMSTLIVIPLFSILGYGFKLSCSELLNIVLSDTIINSLLTSIICAFVAAIVNSISGLILAWTLVRYSFPERKILDALIELPFAIPTSVAGITLTKMYSDTGFIGGILAKFGIRIAYTKSGIVIAMIFVGIPFVVRTIQPVLEKLNPEFEEAAQLLGADNKRIFFKIVLPELLPAMISGFGMAFARGIGEYGSVVYISGNSLKNHTQVASYLIIQKLNYMDYSSAAAIAIIMLAISFIILFLINVFQNIYAGRSASE